MSDKTFVDTNILVHARDSSFPEKQEKALEWLSELWQNRTGRLSVQVLNEYFVTVTRKLKPGRSLSEAWDDLENLSAWNPIPLTFALLEKTQQTLKRYDLSWWDSLIVAAALTSECRIILSEDLNTGQEYFGMRVVNPFDNLSAVPR